MIEADFNISQFRKKHKGLRNKNYVNLRCKVAHDKNIDLYKFSINIPKILTWREKGTPNYLMYQTRYFKTFSFLLKLKHRV